MSRPCRRPHAERGSFLVVVVITLLLLSGVAFAMILWVIMTVLASFGPLACIVAPISLVLWLVILVVHVICIIKGINGERFLIPGISQYADKF